MEQQEFFGYDINGNFVNRIIATQGQFNETGLIAGIKPAETPISTDPRDYPLSRYQFKRYVLENEYDVGIEAVLNHVKTVDLKQYGMFKAEIEDRSQFRFAIMLGFIQDPNIAPLLPTNMTETLMAAAWLKAKDY